jgi:NAD(P)-binding Rossmann-like domain
VIVGAGMAGLAVARSMVEHGAEPPLVLEAGPDEGARHYRAAFDPARAQEMWLTPETDPCFWRPYRSLNDNYTDITGLRRRVGGRSLYWHGVVLPIEGQALADAWPRVIADELTRSWHGGPGLYEQQISAIREWAGQCLAPGTGLTLQRRVL